MKNTRRLSSLKVGESAVVEELFTKGSIRRRLMDMGMVKGTKVQCALHSPLGGMSAYRIRGALIAIRAEDADGIVVSV